MLQSLKAFLSDTLLSLPKGRKYDEHNIKMVISKSMLHAVLDAEDWLEMASHFVIMAAGGGRYGSQFGSQY